MIHRDIEDAIDPWLGRDKMIIMRGARQVASTKLVAMRNFRSTYPDARRGIIIARDAASAPQSPGAPMLVPAYLVDFVDWHRL